MDNNHYWDKFWRRRASRRALLRGSAIGAAGLAAAVALGCGEEEEKPAATATPAAAATLGPEYAGAQRGGVRQFDQGDEPINLNPHVNEIPGSVHAIAIAYNHLMRRWEQAEDPQKFGKVFVSPELAQKWEQVDELTYRFSLAQNVKWHNLPPVNGRQLTSADVKYSFERMIDPKNLELRTRSSLEAIDKIETPDKFTVVVKTKFPYAGFLTNAGHTWAVIVPQDFGDSKEIEQRSIGTRFIFKRWQRGVVLEWERNPEYFLPNMFVDKIVMRIVPDPAARLANFRTGETDSWGGSPPSTPFELIEDVHKTLGDKVRRNEYKAWAGAVTKMAFDTTNEPFKDIRLRRAILYGFNYDAVVKIFGGYATRTGPIAAGNLEWALAPEDFPPVDVDKAKALLAEAGYGPSNPLKVTTKVSEFYSGPQVSQIVKSLLKPLGIEVEVEVMENAEWIAKVYRGTQPYHMSSHADWAFEDPDRGLYTYFHSKGAANQTHYNNPEVDRLLEAQRAEFDLAKRKALVKEAQLKIINDAPQVYIVVPGIINLRYTWLHNNKLMPQGNSNSYRQHDEVWYDPIPRGRT